MNRFAIRPSIVGLAGLVALATAACSRPRAEEKVPARAPTVAVARIERVDLAQTLRVAAEFRPFQEIDVHAKVAGFLKSIYVDVGDRVEAGQLLAVLEIPELQDEMQQDEAAVRRADDEITRSQADLRRAESVHEIAHVAGTRLAGVMKARPGLVAQQDVDEAAARDHIAEAQVATAKAAVASSQQQLEMARATQNKTKTLFSYARITAPFAGTITHRYADTGAMIQAGISSQTQAMPIVKLSQNSRLRLVIRMPESAVSRVRLGAPVRLSVQSLHKSFPGLVARFSDRLETETRTMRVEVDVPNPSGELVPGMYAEASITLGEATGVLVAPVEALDHTARGRRVFLVTKDGRVEPRDVTTGLETGDRVEVRSGLALGDLVVVGNRSQLKAGATVTPKILAPIAAATAGAE